MPLADPSTAEDIPTPTVELTLMRVFVEAYIATVSKPQALRYLQTCAKILATRYEASNVVSIRQTARDKARIAAERQAIATFRNMLEACIARLSALPEQECEDDDFTL